MSKRLSSLPGSIIVNKIVTTQFITALNTRLTIAVFNTGLAYKSLALYKLISIFMWIFMDKCAQVRAVSLQWATAGGLRATPAGVDPAK